MKKILFLIMLLIMPIVIYAQTCDNSKIKVESIEYSNKTGSAEIVNDASISDGKIKLDLKLYEVNDSVEYNIKVKNESNEEMKIDKDSLVNSSDYVTYTFSFESIKPNEEKIIKLKVEYKKEVPLINLVENAFSDNKSVVVNLVNKEESIVNPKTGRMTLLYIIMLLDISLIAYIILNKQTSYKQISIIIISLLIVPNIINATCTCNLEIDSKIVLSSKEAMFDIGENVNIKMKQMAGEDTDENNYRTVDTIIKAIKKSNVEPNESNKTTNHIVSAEYSYYPIYMWLDTDTIYWWSEDDTPLLNSNSKVFCALMTELVDISGLETFNASIVTSMEAFFTGQSAYPMKLSDISPLRNWNPPNLTNISFLLNVCSSITDISILGNWDISKVTTLRATFQSNTSLVNIDVLANWDTSSVTDFSGLFAGCSNISDISALSNWNTSKVTDFSKMFYKCSNISSISALRNWDTSKVTSLRTIFYYCTNLSDISALSNWDVSSVTEMSFMLHNCSKISDISALRNWDTSKVTAMEYVFSNNPLITDLTPLSNWNTSNVTTMGSMFRKCTAVTTLHGLENWDVSKVMNFSEGNDSDSSHTEGAFEGMSSLSDASAINNWNINKNAYFNYMFRNTPVHPSFVHITGTWDSNGTFTPQILNN